MSGLWGFTGPPDDELVRRMGGALRHRTGDAMPMVDTRPTSTIAVAGRDPTRAVLVHDRDVDVSLAFVGRPAPGWRPETLLKLITAEGLDAISEFRGDGILAIATPDTVSVVRDAVGMRTVYWGAHAGRVFVAVEPKGVTAAPGFPRRLHPPSLVQFLAFSFVPGERCALADLFEVPAGHRLDIDVVSGTTRLVRWFVHEDIPLGEQPDTAWIDRTRAVIDGAVRDRVPEGAPFATFLSGGLDSSIVTAAAAAVCRERGDPLPTAYSLHFGVRYPNEVDYAASVAVRTGVEHRVIEVPASLVAERLRPMVWHLDEPIGDPVTAGNFFLAAAASREVGLVLNGEGGDPVFGGPKNLPMLLAHWYPVVDDARFREANYLATWRRASEEIISLLHPDLLAEVDLERDLDAVLRPHLVDDRPVPFLNKLMIANMRLKGAHLILPKVDRMLGAFGVDAASPLFDEAAVRLSLQMPPTLKLHDGIEKWVLKEAYRDALPAAVIDRPKSGMRVPVRWWFQRELKPLARELLSTRAVRRVGWFRPERVREIRRYRTGRDGLRLWMLVNLELWRQMVIEGEAP